MLKKWAQVEGLGIKSTWKEEEGEEKQEEEEEQETDIQVLLRVGKHMSGGDQNILFWWLLCCQRNGSKFMESGRLNGVEKYTRQEQHGEMK